MKKRFDTGNAAITEGAIIAGCNMFSGYPITPATEIAEKITAPGANAAATLDFAENAIYQIAARGVRNEPKTMKTLASITIDNLMKYANNSEDVGATVRTGFYDLDEMLTGFHGGELIILAARPSMGKSSLALNIARKVALENSTRRTVMFFSLEMTAENLTLNIFAAHAKFDAQALRRPRDISQNDWSEIGASFGVLENAQIMIDDSPLLTIGDLRGKARRAKSKGELDLIIIDYLQLMQGSARNAQRSREQEVAEISRGLKALAKELDLPIIALSQLNRKTEDRSGNEPKLSDLRESGAIEQDADVVLLLHRPEYYDKTNEELKNLAKIFVAKQRNGPTGEVDLTFIGHQLRFESLTKTSSYN
jgi:replicative DNA helicase